MTETQYEFDKVKDLVLILLEKEERCRNDDKWLTFRVMQHYTRIFIPFEDFKKIPTFAAITRMRAFIQNDEKLFPPTDPKVIVKRKGRQEDIHDYIVEEKYGEY